MTSLIAAIVTLGGLQISYLPNKGLSVSHDGVTLAQNSFFQYYAPGWTQGFWSSNWSRVKVDDSSAQIGLSWEHGSATVERRPNGFRSEFDFRWGRPEEARVEHTLLLLNASVYKVSSLPAIQHSDGNFSVKFESYYGAVTLKCNQPIEVLDGRNGNPDWANGTPTLWIGCQDLKPPTKVICEVNFEFRELPELTEVSVEPLWEVQDKVDVHPDLNLPRFEGKPKLGWRGVHLFVGPNSVAVHQKLASQVLPKLKINKVLLQCERTDWKCTPEIRSPLTTSLADLKKIFALYRKNGIEPIPLIQSFGHMEWLFANGAYADFIHNPSIPYAIEPENPAAVRKVIEIWEEAVRELQPKTIHFGLDEVDMRGFEGQSATSRWVSLLPQLEALRKRHGVTAMLWGDEILDDRTKRGAVPYDWIVCDWHYEDRDHYPSAKLLSELKRPWIASVWSRPKNVEVFTKDAIAHRGLGALQTIWAGYALSPESFLQHFTQYASTVRLADVAWNGEVTGTSQSVDVFRELLEERRKPRSGWVSRWGESQRAKLNGAEFFVHSPVKFFSAVQPGPTTEVVRFNAKGHSVLLLVRTQLAESIGTEVARVGGQSIRYGYDVRAQSDKEPNYRTRRTADGWSIVEVPAGEVELRQVSRIAGLELGGVTAAR